MKQKLTLFLTLLFLTSALLSGCGAKKDEAKSGAAYPQKPVEVIVAFNSGGGTDIAARSILSFAEKYAGTSFVVNNKPGAGGAIGFTAIAHAPKDGYTIGMINPPTVILTPIRLEGKVKYSLDDFEPIANFVSDPGAFIVPVDSPFKTLKDFIEYAKANPNKVRLGYGGPGTSEALTLRTFEQSQKVEIRKVPFEGTGPQLTALMGKNIDIMISNASEVYAQYQAKSIRVLAVGAEKRIEMMPDVPTYKESGFDATQIAMRGLAAPKGIDPQQLKTLSEIMKKTFDDPEFKKKAQELALPLDYKGPEEYKQMLKQMDEYYRAEFKKNPW
ncbi:MAG: tripartite tricarboxylate transporter substrate binding protein [Sporomusaceae bacterium]|nr:tripartite tricarboxylate transporter substrate binding protein [Sporomusaceae bacterium]